MDRRVGKSRNSKPTRLNRSIGLTTNELRGRKQQRERPTGDLRSRINAGPQVMDARTKLQQKRSVEQLNEKTSITLNARRKQQRSDIHAGNRSLSFNSGSITITSKQPLPPNRCAEMSGQTIKITAKVDQKDKAKFKQQRGKAKDRNLQLNGSGGITIKSKTNVQASPRRKEIRKKENVTAPKFELDEDEIDFLEFKRLKQARMEEKQRTMRTALTSTVPVIDRLDGPFKEPRGTPQTSTKVTISNLHPSVTRQDIEELFGVVGVLKSCKMLQQGTAEVVYTTKENAITAYARYHNRNLDGQPMQCKLAAIQPQNSVPKAPTMLPYRQAAPPSPTLFHTPEIPPYVPTKTSAHQAESLSRPVVFKVKI